MLYFSFAALLNCVRATKNRLGLPMIPTVAFLPGPDSFSCREVPRGRQVRAEYTRVLPAGGCAPLRSSPVGGAQWGKSGREPRAEEKNECLQNVIAHSDLMCKIFI